MILKVNFHDNDFSTVVQEACEDIMYSILNGYSEKKDIEQRYNEYKNRHGFNNIRKAIVLAAYGHLIAEHASSLYEEINYDFSDQDKYIEYLDKEIQIKEVNNFDVEWANGEICFIDFFRQEVYLV